MSLSPAGRVPAVALACAVALSGLLVSSPAYADEVRDKQRWYLEALGAEAAWKHSRGDGVVVAVLDSGVDADQADLAGQVLPGYDVVDGDSDASDTDGHGTAVAALIAGHDDAAGVVGLAPDAKILPVRVGSEKMSDSHVAEGIRWAVDHEASVLNLSLGGARPSDEVADAVQYALDHDVVVVAAAGNLDEDGDGIDIGYPARLPGVIAVTGITPRGKPWHNSSRGPRAALCAPATGVIAPLDGTYNYVGGTSFATPMVAAAAALIRARWPQLSSANVVNRLLRTAEDLGREGRDSRYGFGRVDLDAAVTAEVPEVRENPLLLGSTQTVPASKPPPSAAASPPAAAPEASGVAVAPLLGLLLALLVLLVVMAVLGWLLHTRRPPAPAPSGPPIPVPLRAPVPATALGPPARAAPGTAPTRPLTPVAGPAPSIAPTQAMPTVQGAGRAVPAEPASAERRGPVQVSYLTPVREPYSGVPRTATTD
ncbi:MAG: type VII secretion-associated serine protease mycosin [Micromonosporaceae bacterium]